MRTFALALLAGILALPVRAGSEEEGPRPRPAPDRPVPSVRGPQAILATLQTRRVSLRLEQATLDQFVRYLRAAGGLNIVVRTHALEKAGIDPEAIEINLLLDNVTLLDALTLVLEMHDLGYIVKGNVLLITSKRDARGKPVLRVYAVAHLLVPIRDFPAPDINIYPSSYEPPEPPEPEVQHTYESSEELAELVRQFTGGDTWEDEGVRITVFRHHLFIRTYPSVHAEIARLLAQLPR